MIVLDTHAWVWWVSSPDRLPGPARSAVERTVADGESLFISSISAWEVAMLAARGRLELTAGVDAWIAAAEAVPFIEFVPVNNRIAVRAVTLEGFAHRDPADRIIVSTTLSLGATLVTGDRRLHDYGSVQTLWR